jgi:hypothetical protein
LTCLSKSWEEREKHNKGKDEENTLEIPKTDRARSLLLWRRVNHSVIVLGVEVRLEPFASITTSAKASTAATKATIPPTLYRFFHCESVFISSGLPFLEKSSIFASVSFLGY